MDKPNAAYKLKNLLKKADESKSDPNIALLEYRNSPIDGFNLIPAQILMNRILRPKLPINRTGLEPKPNKSQKSKLEVQQTVSVLHYHVWRKRRLLGYRIGMIVRGNLV